jgi:hypothetical protein
MFLCKKKKQVFSLSVTGALKATPSNCGEPLKLNIPNYTRKKGYSGQANDLGKVIIVKMLQ